MRRAPRPALLPPRNNQLQGAQAARLGAGLTGQRGRELKILRVLLVSLSSDAREKLLLQSPPFVTKSEPFLITALALGRS